MDISKSSLRVTRLRLENFKGFENAQFQPGPLTVLVGANAAGKSNIQDALKLVQTLAITEEDIATTLHQTARGSAQGLFRHGKDQLTLELDALLGTDAYKYRVDLAWDGQNPQITRERLALDTGSLFDVRRQGDRAMGKLSPERSVLTQGERLQPQARRQVQAFREALADMRFYHVDPERAREPAYPSVTALGAAGQGLPAVLRTICADEARQRTLLSWLSELVASEVQALDFPLDGRGRVTLELIEKGGKFLAESASDGTIRFLALTALLLEDSQGVLFLEEVENGLYPDRQHLVLQLIQQALDARGAGFQVFVTSHAPTLLAGLGPRWQDSVFLVYRQGGTSRLKRVADVKGAIEIVGQQGLARLHESGWFEDAVFFEEDDDA